MKSIVGAAFGSANFRCPLGLRSVWICGNRFQKANVEMGVIFLTPVCVFGGRPVTVTISHVEMSDIGGEHKPILYFQGKEKGVVLNKTNAGSIVNLFGDDTEAWEGQPIILFEAMVSFQGQTVPAIRVRAAPVKKNAVPQKASEIINDDIPF